jgi:large repetitive protein
MKRPPITPSPTGAGTAAVPHPRPAAARRRGPKAVLAVAVAMVAALATLVVVEAHPASASTLNAPATISSPTTLAPLASGASTTAFTLALPANAACSGDTASDGYHVYSYLVPQGTNLSTVTFTGDNPPSVGYGLVNNIGTYYGPVNTAPTTGQIIGIPTNFEWAPLVANDGVPLSSLLYTGDTSGVWEAGLACSNSTHALTDNWNTQVTFTANSSDPTGFVWTAVPNSAAAITSANNTTFTEGSAGTFTVTATGNPTPTITESGTLPAGVSFAGGVLSGTPTAFGSFPITFTATNGVGSPATQSFTLTVTATGFQITTTSLPDAVVGQAYSQQLQVSGAGSGSVKWKKTAALPKGLSVSSTGLLSGTPSTKAVGDQTVQVSASLNKGTPQTASIALTVNESPGFGKKPVTATSFNEGTASSFAVTGTGFPAPTFTESGALPSGVTFSSSGVLSGTPAVTTNTGVFSITVTASNGISPAATESFTLTAIAPLVITTTSLPSATQGAAYGPVTLTATGGEGTYTWKKGAALPKGLALSSTGQLSGTVSTKVAPGNYSVQVTVEVKEGKVKVTQPATLTLTVVAAS